MGKQFQIINNGQKQQQKDPQEWCCAFPESSYTQILPRAALCEMECEMSALNIPAVDYTHYLTLGFESILLFAYESVIKLHSPLLQPIECILYGCVYLFNQTIEGGCTLASVRLPGQTHVCAEF